MKTDVLFEAMCRDVRTITGISTVLMDTDFRTVYSMKDSMCPFCAALRRVPALDRECRACDRGGVENCPRGEDLHVYRCHMGLTEAIAPIKEDGIAIGYLMFGQILSEGAREEVRRRVAALPEDFDRVVMGIDPAVTGNRESDETGIVVAARRKDLFYVLDDLSIKGSPVQWAERAAYGYEKWQVDRVVAEVNNGGELVECVLRSSHPDISYRAVRAGHGKIARAEPIAALYEQNRVRHAGRFQELEEQMTGFTPDAAYSPDRLDALVWAMHALLEENTSRRFILC